MPATTTQKSVLRLEGYILPQECNRDEGAEDSEDESNEEQPEFLDMAEIDRVSSGGQLFNSPVPLCEVKLRTFSGEDYKVKGRFALRDPWWEVTFSAVKGDAFCTMKGFPSYRLRSALNRQGWIHIVSLFLKACNVADDYIKLFFDWLPPKTNVSLNNLMEVLDEFSKENEAQARMITTRLLNSVAWMQVQASCLYPRVMRYLPRLLPSQFTQLLGISSKQQHTLSATQTGLSEQQDDGGQEEAMESNLLDKLEQIIANDVWKLGFNTVVYRELKLVRCEAQLGGFKDCCLLQKIPPMQRCALIMYNTLKKHCFSKGSTYMEKHLLCKPLSRRTSDQQASESINFLKEQDVIVIDQNMMVLKNFHVYESGIAKCLRHLVESGPWNIPVNATEVLQAAAKKREKATASPSLKTEVNIDQDQSPAPLEQQAETDSDLSPFKLDQDHVRAAEMICANPVIIISGKAGCGKTTVVSQLFSAAVFQGDIQHACAAYEKDTEGSLGWEDTPVSPRTLSEPEEDKTRSLGWEDPPVSPRTLSQPEEDKHRAIQSKAEILLTAPTGRAASLLSKKTGFPAYTLHQVLYSFMKKPKDNQDSTATQWKFKDVRILVVDEGSMVPVQLLHSVLHMLTKHADLRKCIILGDVRQLPSIQPGNVLHDLFESLKPFGSAIEMRTNHRAESQLIVDNAGLIANKRKDLKFDAIVKLHGPHDKLTDDKKFIFFWLPDKGSDDDLQSAVKFLIQNAPGLNDQKTSQFITFKRNDVNLINELCCKHYNNHTTKNHKNKLVFQPGDKVCCTKNGYLTDVEGADDTNRKETSSVRLCNGEIFFITEDTTVINDKKHSRYVTLEDGDRVHKFDYKELQRECRLQHAWARTIHTFQGSENETVVYVVGNSWAEFWKHIYTAVTRGQKRVYVVSKKNAFESTLMREETPRKTRLGDLVKAELSHPLVLVGTAQAQPDAPQGTNPSGSPQQPTPLLSQTPCRPSGSNFQSLQSQRKRLWKAEHEEEEEEEAAQSSAVNNMSSLSAMDSSNGEQLAACDEVTEVELQNGAASSPCNKRKKML